MGGEEGSPGVMAKETENHEEVWDEALDVEGIARALACSSRNLQFALRVLSEGDVWCE
jgi:hypothetical protein